MAVFWEWLKNSWQWLLLLYVVHLAWSTAFMLYARWRTKRWILQHWAQLPIERKLIILQVRECIAEATTALDSKPVTPEELERWFERMLSAAMWDDARWSLALFYTQVQEHVVAVRLGHRHGIPER